MIMKSSLCAKSHIHYSQGVITIPIYSGNLENPNYPNESNISFLFARY